MSRIMFRVLFLGLIVISGCTANNMSNTWKRTKKFYGEYINRPACINYSDTGSLDEKEVILASRMMGIDTQLEALQRYLENADKPPSDQGVSILLQTFPWISGVALIEPNGDLLAQEPEDFLAPSDFSNIMKAKSRGEMLRTVRGAVQSTEKGPKVFMAVPIYVDLEMKALFVVYFDIDMLSAYSPYSNALVIFSPDTPLWTGKFSFENTPLSGKNWSAILKNSVSGKYSNKNGEFFWLAHFIGEQEIIFATPVAGNYFEETNQCFILGPQDEESLDTKFDRLDEETSNVQIVPLDNP